MGDGDVVIRRETPADYHAVADLLENAFPGPDEARLVERLRADGDLVIALVAEHADEIVGFIAFSPMVAPFRAIGLAPVAVCAEQRRRGIADRLIRIAIDQARAEGWDAAFVLGEPAYYHRFGFRPAYAARFDCIYAGPHLMAMPFGADMPSHTGTIAYAPAFASLGADQ